METFLKQANEHIFVSGRSVNDMDIDKSLKNPQWCVNYEEAEFGTISSYFENIRLRRRWTARNTVSNTPGLLITYLYFIFQKDCLIFSNGLFLCVPMLSLNFGQCQIQPRLLTACEISQDK